MRSIVLSIIVASLLWQCLQLSQAKSVTKRETCSGGDCGSTCSGGDCFVEPDPIVETELDPEPVRCPGGRCGETSCTGGSCVATSCTGGSCGSTSCSGRGCSRTSCPSTGCVPSRPCPVGRCNPCPNGGCERSCSGGSCNPVSTSRSTCSLCGNTCGSICNTGQCYNSCVRTCGCDNTVEETSNKCCEVLHPKSCYTEPTGNKRCVVRRHRECSDLCTSSVVSIQEGQRRTRNTGCQYVRNYPYVYCGNYERHDCGQCYTCDGTYDPRRCSQRSECSESCRSTISY